MDSNYNTLYLCLAISGLQLVFLQFPWKRSVSLIDVASGPSCDSLTNAVGIAWRRKSRWDFFPSHSRPRDQSQGGQMAEPPSQNESYRLNWGLACAQDKELLVNTKRWGASQSKPAYLGDPERLFIMVISNLED